MAELITQTGVPHWLQPAKLAPGDFYPEWVWEHILERLMAGETLTSVCKDPAMPEYQPMLRWIHAEEDRKARYHDARAVGASLIEDQMLAIADGSDNEMEDVQRSTLRISTRKWLLGVWDRKRYGETKQVDHNVTLDLSQAIEQANERINGRQEKVIEAEVE